MVSPFRWDMVLESLPRCPGAFCGRIGNGTKCGACSWGSRVTDRPEIRPSQCEPCLSSPDFHGWLYLSFIALLPVMLFFLLPSNTRTSSSLPVSHRDRSLPKTTSTLIQSTPNRAASDSPVSAHASRCSNQAFILPLACILIHTVTSIVSLLIFPPLGSLNMYTCIPQGVAEFYAVLVAAPGCTYEVVFPYISLPLAYYGLSALICLLVYSVVLCCTHQEKMWQRVVYGALYTYPLLSLLIYVFGGLLYFSFPYVLLLVAVIHSVYRFPVLFDYCVKPADGTLLPLCNPIMLFRALVTNPDRYLPTLFVSMFCYSYGLVAIMHSLSVWAVLLAPTPFLFYAFTLPFTHPFVAFDGDYAFSLATTRCPPDRSVTRTDVVARLTGKAVEEVKETDGVETERVI